MKFALPLLLSGALALAPWSCNRGNAPNESVSANSDQTQRSEQTEQNQTIVKTILRLPRPVSSIPQRIAPREHQLRRQSETTELSRQRT